MEKTRFLVTIPGGKFLCSCGDAVSEYPDAKKFPTEAAAIPFANKHVEPTGSRVLFEVWETEDYAAGGEPCHVQYDLSLCSPMELCS
jgi:hypothetical protein